MTQRSRPQPGSTNQATQRLADVDVVSGAQINISQDIPGVPSVPGLSPHSAAMNARPSALAGFVPPVKPVKRKGGPAKAMDVAKYLVYLATYEDEPDFLSHLRLQKLLYY